jgi:hypothetical protein
MGKESKLESFLQNPEKPILFLNPDIQQREVIGLSKATLPGCGSFALSGIQNQGALIFCSFYIDRYFQAEGHVNRLLNNQ